MITNCFNKTGTVLDALEPDILILDNLISSTEEEFLDIGAKLQTFHQQANEISDLSADVASRIAGKEMSSIIEGFNDVSTMVKEIGTNFASEYNMLQSILINLAQIRNPLVDFEKIVRNLNVLCTLIRIEIAGLGKADTVFNTLSEDIRHLAFLISTKTNNLLEKTDTLMPALNQNISLIETYKSRQDGHLRLLLNKISNNLETLSQRTDLSAKAILDISSKWRQITASTSEIVQSMQIHDITRQRIEHACDALRNLPQKIAALKKERTLRSKTSLLLKSLTRSGGNNGSGRLPIANIVVETCKLQSVQLHNAKEDFRSAVEHILENLQNVAFYASSISEEVIRTTGKNEDQEGSFILEMGHDIDYLSNSVGTFTQINNDLSEAMNSMTKTAADMPGYVKEMKKISIEMQIVALNASIHAAHLGDQGMTLGILADTIHSLAAETAALIIPIVDNIQEVIDNAAKLAAMAQTESLEGDKKTGQINDSLNQMLLSLKKTNTEIESLLPRIEQSGKSLIIEIHDLISSVNNPQ